MKIIESKIDIGTKKIIYESDGKFYYCIGFVQGDEPSRVLTFCISTQIGCVERCKFCATGDHNLIRNLTADEIAKEITDGLACMTDYAQQHNIKTVRLGFEGMGEFSYNADNCFGAVKTVYPILSNQFQEIIVRPTSVGNIDAIKKYKSFVQANEYMLNNTTFQVKLSVNSPFQDERLFLSPMISKKFCIDKILEEFYDLSDFFGQKLRCNYVLFDYPNGGNNYSDKHIKKLSSMLIPEKTKLLLQRYSETGKGFKSPDKAIFDIWVKHFNKIGINTGLTGMKGYDIDAACGMMDYHRKKER